MAKKEVQLFSMSFLDLLSGALAAVIILFIIVPKMDIESKDAVEAMNELGVEVDGLAEKLAQLENSIEKELFEEIMAEMEEVQEALENAQQQVEQLEQQVQELEQQITELEAEVEELQKYKEWMNNCGFTLQDDCPPKECPEPPKTTFMAISTGWQESGNIDVDLWIETPFGRTFSYSNQNYSGYPGTLSRDSQQGPGIELFEILNPPVGEYKVYLNLYNGSGATADVRIFYPKGAEEYQNNTLRTQNSSNLISSMRLITKIKVKSDGEFEFYN